MFHIDSRRGARYGGDSLIASQSRAARGVARGYAAVNRPFRLVTVSSWVQPVTQPAGSAPRRVEWATGLYAAAVLPTAAHTVRPRPELVLPAAALRDRLPLAPAEVGGVRPHALQDAGQLTGWAA